MRRPGAAAILEHSEGAPWTELAIGYNAMLRDNLEVITQVSADLRSGVLSSTLGVIITLPSLSSSDSPWEASDGSWDNSGS